MSRAIITGVQKRFSDVDSFQHINNVSQQMYFDLGKVDFYRRVLGEEVLLDKLRIITVSTTTSYLNQIRFEDDIRVTTTCSKVGNKSLTLSQQILCGEVVKSESRSIMVAFDFEAQEAVAVPDSWRERLSAD